MNKIDFRPKNKVFSDLLPYQNYDSSNEVLWLKDGSAVKTFQLTPRNCMSMTDEELEKLRFGLTSILNQLPEGTLLQFFMDRTRTSEEKDTAIQNWKNAHENKIEASLSEERKLFKAKEQTLELLWRNGCLFQTNIFISIRISSEEKPIPATKEGAFAHLAFFRKKKKLKTNETVLNEMNQAYQLLKNGLETQGFETNGFSESETIEFLFKFFNPNHSTNNKKTDTHINQSELFTLTDFIESRKNLKLGRTNLRIGTLKTLPESVTPCIMTYLATQSIPFSLIMTVLVLPQTQEKERLSRRQRLVQGMAAGNNVRNLAAETQLRDIEGTLESMLSSGEKLLVASTHVLVFEEEDSLNQTYFQKILDEAQRVGSGCQWFEETVGAYPVFFGILPFAPTFITRPKRLLSTVLSDLLPIYGIGPGHKSASILFETPYQSVLGFSLFEKSPTGNAIIIGSTGSGKSTLACGIILEMAARNQDESSKGVA